MTNFAVQFPSGVLVDRVGEQRVVLLAVGGTAVACTLIAAAPLFAALLVATVLLGALAGLHHSVATALLTRTYEDIRTAIGVHNAGGPAAGPVAAVLTAWVGLRYGWRGGVAIGALVAVPLFILFAWRVQPTEPRRPDQPMRERFESGSLPELLSRPRIEFTVYLAVSGPFVLQATPSFLPTFLVEYRGLSPTLAGVVFSVYFVSRSSPRSGSASQFCSSATASAGAGRSYHGSWISSPRASRVPGSASSGPSTVTSCPPAPSQRDSSPTCSGGPPPSASSSHC